MSSTRLSLRLAFQVACGEISACLLVILLRIAFLYWPNTDFWPYFLQFISVALFPLALAAVGGHLAAIALADESGRKRKWLALVWALAFLGVVTAILSVKSTYRADQDRDEKDGTFRTRVLAALSKLADEPSKAKRRQDVAEIRASLQPITVPDRPIRMKTAPASGPGQTSPSPVSQGSPTSTPPPPPLTAADNNCPAAGKLVNGWSLFSEIIPGAHIEIQGIQPNIVNAPSYLQRDVLYPGKLGIEPKEVEPVAVLVSEIKILSSLDDPKLQSNKLGPLTDQKVIEQFRYLPGPPAAVSRDYHYRIQGLESGPGRTGRSVSVSELSVRSQNTVRNIDQWINDLIDKRCADAMAKASSPAQ